MGQWARGAAGISHVWGIVEQAQSGSFTSPQVGAGCEASRFVAGRLQALLKSWFLQAKDFVFWTLVY